MNKKMLAELAASKNKYRNGLLHEKDGVQTTNHEGAPAYLRDFDERLVQILTTGFFGNKFYATGAELSDEAYPAFVRAQKSEPTLLAKAAVYARTDGLRRSTPMIALGMLAGGRGVTKEAFLGAFDQVAQIEDDLLSFGELLLGDAILGRRTLGGMARIAIRRWFERYGIAEFAALKYGSSARKGLTLADLLNLTHPKAPTKADAERFAWLCKGPSAFGSDETLNPQLRAYERLKRTTDEAEACRLIRTGRLPMQAVIPALKSVTPALWRELLRATSYTNLVRSLATFTRHGVFADKANVQYAVARLTDKRAIAKSGLLPFYFLKAHRAYRVMEGSVHEIVEALPCALEHSFDNVPAIGEDVAIGIDVSFSMIDMMTEEVESESQSTKAEKSAEEEKDVRLPQASFKFIDIAGIQAGALIRKATKRVEVVPFDHEVRGWHMEWNRESTMAIADRLTQLTKRRGGTALSAPVEELTRRNIRVQGFIGVTDNVDWVGQGFLNAWHRYRAQVNPEAQAYLVTIAPYAGVVAPSSEKSVHFVYGWSDEALSYVVKGLQGGMSQVERVRSVTLGLPSRRRASIAKDVSADEEA